MPMYSSQRAPQYHESDVVPELPRRPRPSGMKNGERRSIGGRTFRTLARFFIPALIGVGVVGVISAWQSHGEEAKEMVKTWAPSLGWLLPVATTKSPPDGQGSAAAAATSAELVQQLKSMALDLAVVRRSVEQLAAAVEQLGAKQEQMAQNIATLQAVEQDINQKMSSPRPSRVAPPRKPPQPTAQSSAVQSSSVPPPPPPAGSPLR
jgi:hypothetical protein